VRIGAFAVEEGCNLTAGKAVVDWVAEFLCLMSVPLEPSSEKSSLGFLP